MNTPNACFEEALFRALKSIASEMKSEIKSEVRLDMKTEMKSEVQSEVRCQMEELRGAGSIPLERSDASKEGDAKEVPDDLGATSNGSKTKKNKKKKGAKKRAANKGIAGKKKFGMGGSALIIALAMLCVAALLVASKSGDDESSRRLQERTAADSPFASLLSLRATIRGRSETKNSISLVATPCTTVARRLQGAFQVFEGSQNIDDPCASLDPAMGAVDTEDRSRSIPPSTLLSLERSGGVTAATSIFEEGGISKAAPPTAMPEDSNSIGTNSPIPTDTAQINACPDKLLPVDNYPGCCVPLPDLIGDGICNIVRNRGLGNTEVCGFDGGDCEAPEMSAYETTGPSSAAVEDASVLPMPPSFSSPPSASIDAVASRPTDQPTYISSAAVEDVSVLPMPSSYSSPPYASIDAVASRPTDQPTDFSSAAVEDASVLPTPSSYSSPPSASIDAVDSWPTDQPTYLPTVACLGANPDRCGCGGSNYQRDYRGTINTTASGYACERWDADWAKEKYKEKWGDYMQMYPDAGLENNYCRNPYEEDRALCFVKQEYHEEARTDWDYCDVPYCMTGPEQCSDPALEDDGVSGNLTSACNYHQCAGNTTTDQPSIDAFFALSREEVEPTCQCDFEIWDCKYGSLRCWIYDCCIDKVDESDISSSSLHASCECFIKPGCEEEEDGEMCHVFAEVCCGEDDIECQCKYNTKACELQLNETNVTASYCTDAEVTCCDGKIDVGGCLCDLWDPLCTSHPNAVAEYVEWGVTSCDKASNYCCGCCDEGEWEHCYCDLLTYATSSLGFENPWGNKELSCSAANRIEPSTQEKNSMKNIYKETGGDVWFNNTGWMSTDLAHCEWFGISCDNNGYVTKIEMSNNNLIGKFPADSIASFYKLRELDLSNNSLSGMMGEEYDQTYTSWNETSKEWNEGPGPDTSIFYNLRALVRVDLSHNKLSGEVDILFAPALEYVNFSHNNFTSVDSFKRFKKSHSTLLVANLSHNNISQNISDILKNVPTQLEEFYLSSNSVRGSLPVALKQLNSMKRLYLDSNWLSGSLPDFSVALPKLQELDMSNQKQESNQGLVGIIPDDFADLSFLSTLNLTNNGISGTIPPFLADLSRLQMLDLSHNKLTKTIPAVLGKLGGVLKILDLSDNILSGSIPELSSLEDAFVHLSNNPDIRTPAPLELCFFPGFDLKDNVHFCPIERNTLKKFYDSAKGNEWANSTNWTDPYINHCDWYGVHCNDSNTTIKLDLRNNGLSGTLSSNISDLSSLEYLNLADNDIMGSIPSEIGLLFNLTYLRLSHNSLMGNAPTELGNLQKLEFVQLNDNRISGTIPRIKVLRKENSSFVADCGSPSDFDKTLECPNCTMCCNANGDCFPNKKTYIQKAGFDNYIQLSEWVLALLMFACFVLAVVVFAYDNWIGNHHPTLINRQSTMEMDAKYALETIGHQSVYHFMVGRSIWGWFIALATMAIQICMLFVFVRASEKDLSSDKTDLVYTWKCPRGVDECRDTSNLSYQGWLACGFLMSLYLLKDIIGGAKMIILSAKQRHDIKYRIRFFFGGMLLSSVTWFSWYVSTIYNYAIATSDTEVIVNSVIILFVCEVDEKLYGVLRAINQRWVEEFSRMLTRENHDAGGTIENNNPDSVPELNKKVELLTKKYEMLLEKVNHIVNNGAEA